MGKKLSGDQRDKIRSMAECGTPQRDIARAVGCSAGSVANVLKESPKSPPAPPGPAAATAPPAGSGGPELEAPTLEQLAADVAEQIREARADAAAARLANDDAKLARATKNATTLTLLLARVTRGSPASGDQVVVDRSKMQAAADSGFAKLTHYLEIEAGRRGGS